MEPTAAEDTENGPVARLVTAAMRRHPARAGVASLTAVALLVGAISAVVATRHHASPNLVLAPAVRSPTGGVAASPSLDVGIASYRFRLAMTPPDFGSDAPVARLESPPLDEAHVRTMATALGIRGVVIPAGGGWQVTDGARQLSVEPTPGGWVISEAANAVASPGPILGSSGTGHAASATVMAPVPLQPIAPPPGPDPSPPPPVPAPGVAVPTPQATPPANLVGPADAERIARSLLERMGIGGADWSVAVDATTTGGAVTCTPEPCAMPDHLVLASRTVELRPRFQGAEIGGLSWQVEIGAGGDIVGLSGTWANVQTLGRYPLRPVASVFADLVAGRGIDPEPLPVMGSSLGEAVPFQGITQVTVTIDHVSLGYALMPASDNGVAVVDIVPTYVFAGHTNGAGMVSREMVAVRATVSTPRTNVTNTPPGKPESPPAPASPLTAGGTPVT
jgi:hypothetical protein